MFNWRKKDTTPTPKRSLDELRRQLRTLDAERTREIKGGNGIKLATPALVTCGGWLPQ